MQTSQLMRVDRQFYAIVAITVKLCTQKNFSVAVSRRFLTKYHQREFPFVEYARMSQRTPEGLPNLSE